ncbi:magnesium transporter MRS2-11, chloroplastic [Rhododendron vialii]|uniref:magnesium transporter MRS2-11, chloroplastic n=1 Tax=Rhododendron vialii TaxID=182163 RepID=UPI00265EB0A6|nr:magnesium transporter MRS2-11, chloroplastic [Rhododendron vialii]
MAITTPLPPSTPSLLQLPLHSPSFRRLIFAASVLPIRWTKRKGSTSPISVKDSSRVRCLAQSTEESQYWTDSEALTSDGDDDAGDGEIKVEPHGREDETVPQHSGANSSLRIGTGYSSDTLSLGIREFVYEVVEVKSNGMVSTRKINRRHLLKSSGLRPRDIRSVDPSLWLTNTMPSLLVRENAILLNLGSLRAIAMQESVFIFNYNRKGGKAFIDTLLPRLNPKNMSGGPSMAFELEVVEAALHSRIQRLEHRLMDLEPRVQALLEVLPNRLTADILEQLRISKQTLVELDSKAGALKQMLLDILEDSHEIRLICIMGRNCTLRKGNDDMECSVPLEKQIAEEEEEEIEMLLENYLQRCESCHGQAERLLDSAKEMEDSIAVNLSSRRLEVSRVELLLQVGTFCVAVGALVAGIFGMNLKSYLEEHVFAFWLTTAGIIFGAVIAFFLMYTYLRVRKVL